jgi:hypothetical protein
MELRLYFGSSFILYFVLRVRRHLRVKNLLINEYVPNVAGEVTNLTLPRIRDIVGSNIGSETAYPD